MEEPNNQCPTPADQNRERGSNVEEDKLTLEEATSEDFDRPKNQRLTYHRRFPDGKYVPVYLSLGFRFHAEDVELIKYLNKRIDKAEATCVFIPTVNVYKHSPEELAELHQCVGVNEMYFFSPRDRKYLNGNRPNRAAGNGYWKATGADKNIHHNGEYIGSKKCLVYYEGKAQMGRKTHWVMNEYLADQPLRQRRGPDDMRLDDCVLCRIYKNSCRSSKSEKQTAAPESGPTPELNLQVQQPSGPTPLQVQQPSGPMPQLNLHVLQPNLENLQVLQPNPPTPQLNLQVLQPNVPQQNLEAIQYSLQAGRHNLGGPLDCQSESIPEDTRQIHFDNLENSHGSFWDLIPTDMVGNLTHPPVFRYLNAFDQTLNYFNPHQSMDRFTPGSLFGIDDYPQDRH